MPVSIENGKKIIYFCKLNKLLSSKFQADYQVEQHTPEEDRNKKNNRNVVCITTENSILVGRIRHVI